MAKKYIDNKRRRIGYSDPNEPCWIAKNVKILLFRSLKKIRQKVGGGVGGEIDLLDCGKPAGVSTFQ